ncbi:MAG: DUF6629 family protein [Sphingobacteriales bacterium]
MCFSANASFGAGAVLLVVGALTLKKVHSPSQIAFASIPLLFSVQQFAEGLLWLSLTNKNYEGWEPFSTHFFLFFAQVLWPLWVPVSILLLERNTERKKILFILTGIGILLSSYFAWCLLNYPVKAEVIFYHIYYTLDFPHALVWVSGILYLILTVFPPFMSSHKKVWLLGIMIAASYLFTKIAYSNYLISVWCFFAAIISVLVLYIVTKMNKFKNQNNQPGAEK